MYSRNQPDHMPGILALLAVAAVGALALMMAGPTLSFQVCYSPGSAHQTIIWRQARPPVYRIPVQECTPEVKITYLDARSEVVLVAEDNGNTITPIGGSSGVDMIYPIANRPGVYRLQAWSGNVLLEEKMLEVMAPKDN